MQTTSVSAAPAATQRHEERKPKGKPTAAQARKRAQTAHRWTRRVIQLFFFIMAPALFSGAFNGVKYLFGQIGLVAGIEVTSFVALLAMLAVFTVVFGRFFCGFACAFGTAGDYLYAAFEFLRSKTPIPRPRFPEPLVRALSLVKYVVLAAICVACLLGVWSTVSHASPWVAFAGLLAFSLEGIEPLAFVLLGLVAVGMILRERFFCQFLCPLGAILSLLPVLGFSSFTRTRGHCARNCGRCRETCPVDIWPDGDKMAHGECISCGRCADACPMSNVNLVAIERPDTHPTEAVGDARPVPEDAPDLDAVATRPTRKTRDSWRLLRGTGTATVLAKAAVLLAACWVLGATRYLPAFGDVLSALGIIAALP